MVRFRAGLVSGFWAFIILVAVFGVALNVPVVRASGTIYIRADGSINPPTAPIQRDGDIYTLTGNITSDADGIVVERSKIVIDGVGHTLQGSGSGAGFSLTEINNVTIKDTNIKGFTWGICLMVFSINNNILGNNITNNQIGIYLNTGAYSNNIMSGNIIEANVGNGIHLLYSYGNIIRDNNVKANTGYGISLTGSSNNVIYHNHFIHNGLQVEIYASPNVWNDGYPSGGNYWSDYDGTDSDYDSVGDTPYLIDANNQDNYPLMGMFSSFSTSYGYAVDFVSNSSILDVSFNLSNIEVYPPEATLTFNVSGEADSEGFLRVCIPKVLINGSYVIRFDDQIITNITYPQIRELPCSNETHVYFYINYTHSEHAIIITGTTMIPEFPSLLILPLLMTATLLAIIVSKKKICINAR